MRSTEIKVFTLNCWGIELPVVCKNRHERFEAIGNELAKGEYDLITLQEVWSNDDYDKLCKKLKEKYPYSHYFHGGAIGTGVCIFSKGLIVEAISHRYPLNGYAHKIWHGDWFGGKSAGLCKIFYKGININFYSTHVHAEYNRDDDEYIAHRVSQAVELSQFIKHSSENCDLIILGGDLNFEPQDTGYNVVRHNTGLLDAWEQQSKPHPSLGMTCGLPSNWYTTESEKRAAPDGKRIDYIMYKANTGTTVKCLECYPILGKIPSSHIPYSDHEALSAVFNVEIKDTPSTYTRSFDPTEELETTLRKALEFTEKGLGKAKKDSGLYLLYGLIFLLLTFIVEFYFMDVSFGLGILMLTFRTVAVLCIGFFVWMGGVHSRMEVSGLTETREQLLLLSNKHKYMTMDRN